MLTGLLANALGLDHRDGERLNRLQARIRFAARLDREGEPVVDYQTVDLRQEFLQRTGWTTRGQLEERGKGEATSGTHIRLRHYRADAACLVFVALEPPTENPTIGDLAAALSLPERPLWLGRKCCLPSDPIFVALRDSLSLSRAMRAEARAADSSAGPLACQWPAEDDFAPPSSRVLTICDERDWVNQIHAGERRVRHGVVEVAGGEA
jgi:CRISPR system Cascade subunit CasD